MNAFYAKNYYEENTHYTIQDRKIIPVDYRNTGSFHHNTQWQNGLHQFLQIKHGFHPTT